VTARDGFTHVQHFVVRWHDCRLFKFARKICDT